MKFLFIDEVEQSQSSKTFFGLGGILIDSCNYKKFKEEFDNNFKKLNWNKDIEFKGKFLFSSKSGDSSITSEDRVEFVNKIAETSVCEKNSRYKFYFTFNDLGKNKDNYKTLLIKMLSKINKQRDSKGDKNLIAIFLDDIDFFHNDIKFKNVFIDEVNKTLNLNNYILFERPFFINSDNYCEGIITVDVLCYLKLWEEMNNINNTNTKNQQVSIFNYEKSLNDAKKIKICNGILEKIKKIKTIK